MQVSEHIHALKIPFKISVGPDITLERFVYAFTICSQRICLIDSGVAGAERLVFDAIRHNGRSAGEISQIVLTHSHPDHIGAGRAIRQVTRCAVAAHPAEKAWIEDVELQCRQRPVPGFGVLVGGSVKVDRELADGDVMDLGGKLKLEVLHTPGHSAGSISLRLLPDNVLFCGDAIPLPGDLPIWEDCAALVRSIERIKAIEGLQALLSSWDAPGQGEAIRQTIDRSLQYLRHIQQVVGRVTGQDRAIEPMELCKRVVAELGLPPTAVNPLVARSFAACAKAISQ